MRARAIRSRRYHHGQARSKSGRAPLHARRCCVMTACGRRPIPLAEVTVKQLIAYRLENMIIDFQGDITLETMREFLRDDDSREARALLNKLVEDGGVSDMMITLADCLQENLKSTISDDTMR